MPRRHRPHLAPPGSLTASQVGEIMHCSGKTVARWAQEGRLPFMWTLGGHRRYNEATIRKLVEELRQDVQGV